jgi:hypothetical protein
MRELAVFVLPIMLAGFVNAGAEDGAQVLASQYRGNDGGEGLEQFGGADVGDVVALVSLGDEEVPVSQALTFAASLSSLRKEYELIVYAKEVHEGLNNRRDRDARIVAWFKRYLR